MAQLTVYFSFSGKCKEALNFYKECFNGEIVSLMTFNDLPPGECANQPIAESWKDKVMHAEFKARDLFFMASDGMEGEKLDNSHTPINISLNFTTEHEQKEIFTKLAQGGQITMELQDTFWGAKFGTLTDKFGIKWMFNYDKNPK